MWKRPVVGLTKEVNKELVSKDGLGIANNVKQELVSMDG